MNNNCSKNDTVCCICDTPTDNSTGMKVCEICGKSFCADCEEMMLHSDICNECYKNKNYHRPDEWLVS